MFSAAALESTPFLLAFLASFADTFALTGLFVWGYGVVLAVGLMIQQNIAHFTIMLFLWAVTLGAECVNLGLAKWLRKKVFIQTHVASLQHRRSMKFFVPHAQDKLWSLALKFTVLRFTFFARPLATILATIFGVKTWHWFVAQVFSSALWVVVWFYFTLLGVEALSEFFPSLFG